jgi:tetratricopeptide (TPR) repeat protein
MLQEAQEKIAGAVSTVGQAMGGPSALSVEVEGSDVRKLLVPQKRKRAKRGPIYERTWFLAGCLGLVIAAAAWVFWPMSERKLFENASALMATDDAYQWDVARQKYLEPLLSRFPNGQYAAEAQAYMDKIEMRQAEARFRRNTQAGRPPESEAERLFAAAWRYEQFGDRVTALEKYQSMIELLKDREQGRPFVNLARRQAAAMEAGGVDKEDRVRIVNEALDRADKLYEDGQVLEARKIWNSIIALYQANREMEPLVKRASSRLAGQDESPDAPRDGAATSRGTADEPNHATTPETHPTGGTKR